MQDSTLSGLREPLLPRHSLTSERDLADALKRVGQYVTKRASEKAKVRSSDPNPHETNWRGFRVAAPGIEPGT